MIVCCTNGPKPCNYSKVPGYRKISALTTQSDALRIEVDSFQDCAAVRGTTIAGSVDSSSVGRTVRGSAVGSNTIRGSAIGTHIMPTCNPISVYQLLPILLSEEVHPTGGSLQPIPALTSRPSSPTHGSSITQSPGDTISYTGSAPPLPPWRWRVVQSQLLSYNGDLRMVSRTPHATAPGHLPVLKEEFSTHLSEIAAGKHVSARLQLLNEAPHSHGQDRALHVFGRLAQSQGARHTEEMI